MSSPQQILLCQYRYDPLDRLTGHVQSEAPVRQRFYCKSRLATEVQGAIGYSIVQHDDLLLAQQQRRGDSLDTTLLAADVQRSVLQTAKANAARHAIAYSPYGHRPAESGLSSLLGFNGERPDPVTGCYLLGNGYRAFNPVLMRFNSPDSLSPFGKGGLNSYAYCLGDPINTHDPSGHASIFLAVQLLRWSRRAAARIVKKTGEIVLEEYSTFQKVAKLSKKTTPEMAVSYRAKIHKVSEAADNFEHLKYRTDLAHARHQARITENLTGIPASNNEQLKLLESIADPNSAHPLPTINYDKLFDISKSVYDPATPLHQRASPNTAKNYMNQISLYSDKNPDRKVIFDEAERLKWHHFPITFIRRITKIRQS
ncbi:RHS repeat-associated core domain-containing protein [Pseudomonas vancouverensis]|uniref:RHS repeat-associated core domain-containing protein n=1 Tax=Pseudomonas vancouverensis TaxID=95300 RepID=A0A1H2NHL4_PSEVA|nr:RHS repeat-associated core domain-containing protein [Pseudomonas vancouverensis]KAB0495016.1 RHS repeat-associated core domain-containing protein [Pseudomonas vancouverensis]TDB63944.1 RHS repeat-associated core domain-containing protein [Pseudomonas vancouverensis]SDV04923.1 RHS repeat-associated core domain-containing protein [Pseudomonas vancouverensis]